ncbi:MAG: MCP four helix bundle domain-containing protein [Schwartzia sp.]|nr:MCP four helix bundle domain-containing protein [Schwartzia sp. (in: firmicutes)]
MMDKMELGIIGKLRMLVLVMAALAIGCGVYWGMRLYNTNNNYWKIYNDDAYAANQAMALSKTFSDSRTALTRTMMRPDASARQQSVGYLSTLDAKMDELMTGLESRAVSEEGKRVTSSMKNKIAAYRQARAALLNVNIPSGQSIDSVSEWQNVRQLGDELASMLDNIADIATKSAETHMADQRDSTMSVIVVSGIIILIVTVAVIVLEMKLTNLIQWRLAKLAEEAQTIADGDLVKPIYVRNSDEIGIVAQAFEKMRRRMHDAMADIHMAADQVAAGAKNVSDASVSLSQGAAEQASSVEQLSSSISQISSQTSSNAENASRADDLTQKAKEQADIGDSDMKSMLEAMEQINVSSANISKIIKVIDEIAFQTNILALNAAVEAARAGQHGKGFAVVAEEVRNLAARSAKAAKETTDMIEDSIRKVNSGREIAGKTAEALQNISDHVTDVAHLVGDIAKASKEQKLALEQIDQGVLQVSQVVQGNSATSQQAASASEQLSAQAARLKETAGRFRLAENITPLGGNRNMNADPQISGQQATQMPPPPQHVASHAGALPPSDDMPDNDFGKY